MLQQPTIRPTENAAEYGLSQPETLRTRPLHIRCILGIAQLGGILLLQVWHYFIRVMNPLPCVELQDEGNCLRSTANFLYPARQSSKEYLLCPQSTQLHQHLQTKFPSCGEYEASHHLGKFCSSRSILLYGTPFSSKCNMVLCEKGPATASGQLRASCAKGTW